MREPVIIRLTPDIIEYADNVAALRQGSAFLKHRSPANGLAADFEVSLAHHRLGARCEAAGKIYLNPITWHALAERIKNLPDLGAFIDVKGRPRDTNDLIVQKDANDQFAYLFISAEHHPDYHIFGWAWGYEAKQQRFWRDPAGGRPAYFMPNEELPHSPDELRALIHDKQEEMMQFAREVLN